MMSYIPSLKNLGTNRKYFSTDQGKGRTRAICIAAEDLENTLPSDKNIRLSI